MLRYIYLRAKTGTKCSLHSTRKLKLFGGLKPFLVVFLRATQSLSPIGQTLVEFGDTQTDGRFAGCQDWICSL